MVCEHPTTNDSGALDSHKRLKNSAIAALTIEIVIVLNNPSTMRGLLTKTIYYIICVAPYLA